MSRPGSDPQPNGSKPLRATKPAGLRSPSILGMQAAGWLVLACLWLPINRGCGGTVNRPIEQLRFSLPITLSEVANYLWFLGSYGNGLLAAMLLSLSALWCSETLWWRSFLVQGFCACALCITTLAVSLQPFEDTKGCIHNLLVFLPPMILSFTWIRKALLRGERQTAWARLQHCWTLAGFIMLNLQCLLSIELLYGYWVSLAGFAWLTFFVELARYRMQHDLWDASLPTAKPQFAMRSIFFWTTLCALTIGYYRAIEQLISWLYPEG